MLRQFELGVEKTAADLDLLGRDDWTCSSRSPRVPPRRSAVLASADPSHPSHDADWAALRGDPIERVYRALDEAIGTILEHAGAAHVLLFAIHGMRAHWPRNPVPEILYRLGVTVPRSEPLSALARAPVPPPGDEQRPLSQGPREAASTARPSDDRIFRRADLGASRCFPILNGHNVGAIRLNLAGRERRAS